MMESPLLSGSCRCCASEGAYKDVKSSYHWMGEEEIYADMLKDCFDITLSPASDGQDEGGICEICITQLRNAANFKKQVLHTDEQFKNKLQSGYFKPEIVKVELPGEDGIDSDDNNASVEEGYSGPEFEVPIKAESPEESKPKKRAAKKGPTTRAKKAKTDAEDAETSTKRIPHTDNSEIEPKHIYEMAKHRNNLRHILECSNATPIRCRGRIGYDCCFCTEEFLDPGDLKRHNMDEHDHKFKRKVMYNKNMFSYLFNLDITSLRCIICDTSIDTLEQLIEHLTKLHGKHFYTDIKQYTIPFKFDDDVLRCVFCLNVCNSLKTLRNHMNVHIRNYICDICDTGYINRNNLINHLKTHKIGKYKCDYCSNVYDTMLRKNAHEHRIHVRSKLVHKCTYCIEKFSHCYTRDRHMETVHGIELPLLKCQACNKTFVYQGALRLHIKRYHLMDKTHKCTQCDMRFFLPSVLKRHMSKHTGDRKFKCEVCHKFFARKCSLKVHTRIHENDRRFKCEYCDLAFFQKSSMASHVRSKHGPRDM